MNKKILILGGGTFSHVRSHMSLAAMAYGETARTLFEMCGNKFPNMDIELVLTRMANSGKGHLETNDDVKEYISTIINDNTVKVVFFNIALCDFDGMVDGFPGGKYKRRLETKQGPQTILITPTEKIIRLIREKRKDIFLIGFKTTCNESEEIMFQKGLNLLKKASCNLVLANDVVTRKNMIITPEEGVYANDSGDNAGWLRAEALRELVEITWHRTHLSFTHSTVVDGKAISWEQVSAAFPALTQVVDHCIEQGAYKAFNGATTGHFAAKLADNQFVTSIRKTNFNDIGKVGMVKVVTDGPDSVISYGAKPSVGGQSQRIVFGKYPDMDCIVHFHCPLRNSHEDIPVVSQREYECGSHECGENTARGLEKFGNLYCVMLDKHGPNIVFNKDIDPQEVIDFIDRNFDLSQSTSGFQKVDLKLV